MALQTNKNLPIPSHEAQVQSQQLCRIIQQAIAHNEGWISFAYFMQMALYTPDLGYYSGGVKKFGVVEISLLRQKFHRYLHKRLARQAAQVQAETQGDILELGAGTGMLAADLLLELARLNKLPNQYFIMEVSDYLRQIQRETCQEKLPAELFAKFVWLETLPNKFNGLVLGNEVLDAIPHIY